jgi:hypothetical protein
VLAWLMPQLVLTLSGGTAFVAPAHATAQHGIIKAQQQQQQQNRRSALNGLSRAAKLRGEDSWRFSHPLPGQMLVYDLMRDMKAVHT